MNQPQIIELNSITVKTKHFILAAVALILPLTALTLATTNSPKKTLAKQVARGKYLVAAADCSGCHTPLKFGPNGPEPDMSRLLSGHPEDMKLPPPPKLDDSPWFVATAGMTAWAGPWGISYSANITPDQATGIGIWTERMFIQTIRSGKHYGVARDILPPMPWQAMSNLTDDDLKAIYAYLQTVPPIRNQVPTPEPPGGAVQFE